MLLQEVLVNYVFTRLNNFTFWFLPFSLSLILISDILCINTGWTLYAPLSAFHADYSVDFMIFAVHFAGLSSLISSINFIITIRMRWCCEPYFFASNLTLFCWSLLVTAWLLVLTIPILAACVTMLLCDRHFNTSFYDPYYGGDEHGYVKWCLLCYLSLCLQNLVNIW